MEKKNIKGPQTSIKSPFAFGTKRPSPLCKERLVQKIICPPRPSNTLISRDTFITAHYLLLHRALHICAITQHLFSIYWTTWFPSSLVSPCYYMHVFVVVFKGALCDIQLIRLENKQTLLWRSSVMRSEVESDVSPPSVCIAAPCLLAGSDHDH